MTTQDYLKCRRYYENHILKNPSAVGFKELFRIFSRFGISSYEELLNSPTLYSEFVVNQIFSEEDDISETQKERIKRRLNSFEHYLSSHLKPNAMQGQQNFATMVSEFITNKQNNRILDVGAGEIPHSSIQLARTFDHVYSMDHLLLAEPCLKSLNVVAKPMYFGSHTNITNYDYVVGQCPCTAIEYIVQKCAKQNKGYFIQLCNCNLPATAESWEDVLPEYDSKIKFHLDYAYNLDSSSETVKKIIGKYDPHKTRLKTMPTISVSYIQDVSPSDWKIDDTPNEVTAIPSTNSKNWEIDESFDINPVLEDDMDLL